MIMSAALEEKTGIDTSEMEVDESVTESTQLTKSEKMKQKRKAKAERKRLEKANKPIKPKPEPKLPSSVTLPERRADVSQFADETALLSEIRRRLVDQNAQTLRVCPIPKKCPPGLLHDLCPTAISVRLPVTNNARYGFLEFKSQVEAQAALKKLSDKHLDGKALIVTSCADRVAVPDGGGDKGWKDATERTLAEFDLCSLYVSRLPRSVLRTDLAQIFRTAANVKFVTLPDGTCRGSCQLRFRSQIDAIEAFTNLHETVVKGIPIHINFAIKSLTKPQKTIAPIPVKVEKSNKKRRATTDHNEEGGELVKRPRTEDTNVDDASSKKSKTKKHNKKSKTTNSEFSVNKQKMQSGSKKDLPKLQSYQIASTNDRKKMKKVKKPRAK